MGRILVRLLVVGAVLAGVLVFLGPLMDRLTQPESFCPETFGSEKVARYSDLSKRSVPYTGPGPHSVVSYEAYTDSQSGEVELSGSRPSQEKLPKTWDPKYVDEEPVDVQLLLCVYPRKTGVSQSLGQCDGYGTVAANGGALVTVKATPVTYLLYEAATKRPLTKFELTATDYVPADCPDRVYYRTDEEPVIWIWPKPADVAVRLKPFVEAAR